MRVREEELLQGMAGAARQAGEIIRSARDIGAATHEKTSPADLVTDYDLAVEALLRERLLGLLPGAVFYGEEEAERADPTRGWAFIVDPIDGTTNFVRGIRMSAVSVAAALDGEVRCAVVYDPAGEELFSAALGAGAFRNGRPIHVSTRPLDHGIFLMGTATYCRELLRPTLRLTERLMARSCDFRRMGAASLDLCYVACGRAELYFEYSLCPWDHAAGALILKEAGGLASDLEGRPLPLDRRTSLWAANAVNFGLLAELTAPAGGEPGQA